MLRKEWRSEIPTTKLKGSAKPTVIRFFTNLWPSSGAGSPWYCVTQTDERPGMQDRAITRGFPLLLSFLIL